MVELADRKVSHRSTMRRISRASALLLPLAGDSAQQSSSRHWSLWGTKKKDASPADVPSDKKATEALSEEEATAFAALLRASGSARDFVSKKLELPQGSSVVVNTEVIVKNFPKEQNSPVKEFTRSTSDFLSKADPNITLGTGMVRGFSDGIVPRGDNAFSFQSIRSARFIVPKDEASEKAVAEAVDHRNIRMSRMARMKREAEEQRGNLNRIVKGGTGYSVNEHSLFADLDYDRDWVLLGNTPEEFEKNIVRLQKLVSQYRKWERVDNRYWYGMWFFRIAALFSTIECTHLIMQMRTLQAGYEDFSECIAEDIALVASRRKADLALALLDLETNPPDFTPVVDALQKEKKRREEAVPVDPNQPIFRNGRLLNHPMDTSFIEATNAMKEEETKNRQLSLLAANVREDKNKDVTSRSFLGKSFGGLFGRLSTTSGGTSSATAPATDISRLSESDLAAYSYAVAPTSIDAVRTTRRMLLPRADDMFTIVKEEMLKYKADKLAALNFPQ